MLERGPTRLGKKEAMTDVRHLEELLEGAGAQAGRFYLFRGRGRLLAALPVEHSAFLKTLALYRPQRISAQSWVWLIRILHAFRMPGLVLQPWSWPGAARPSTPCPGVLLGNPAHSVPRAIFLLRDGPGWQVGKFVPDPQQQQILHREKELFDLSVHHGNHTPRCRGWKPCGLGGALWMDGVEARRGKPSILDRLRILHDWLLPKPPRPLSDFPAWISAGGWPGGSAAEVQAASQIPLRPCIRHGDFAPWNLLQRADGTWVAVDWEEGCAEDAPGLDLIHDLLQKEFLIRRSTYAKAKVSLLASLQKPPCAEYLAAAGWSGHEDILLNWALALEARTRPEIKRWIQSC